MTSEAATSGEIRGGVVADSIHEVGHEAFVAFNLDHQFVLVNPAFASMVGYSARLATSTTFTSLVFSGLAHVPEWRLSVIFALPCLVWSGVRLLRARQRWCDPVVRARVISTTAA